MKEYAEINTGIVSNIIAVEEGANYPITSNMIDITNLIPQPEIGDSYSDGTFTSPPPILLTPDEYADLAKDAAQVYIQRFYKDIEITHILLFLLQGNPAQKMMSNDVHNWIDSVINEAITHASNPDFEQFTPPTYTYLQILKAT